MFIALTVMEQDLILIAILTLVKFVMELEKIKEKLVNIAWVLA